MNAVALVLRGAIITLVLIGVGLYALALSVAL